MQRQIQVQTDVDRAELAAVLADLGTYPAWLEVVHTVEAAPAVAGDAGPAWYITLRAQIGRLARSKRLRVVRTVASDERVRFERSEADERTHAQWVMDATIIDRGPGAEADFTLRYDGGLWSTVLDAVLGDQVGSATQRLPQYLAARHRD